jgi:hypothetical protein
MLRNIVTAATVFVFAGVAAGALFLSGLLSSQAVQNPSISLDMVTTGNAYVPADDQDFDGLPDPGTNVMNVGAINNCLTTAPPGNAATHLHNVHLIIQNVEDLVAWQVRANFIGDKMRINTVSFTPFTDPFTGQTIGFTNLPYDLTSSLHRTLTSAGGTGPAAPPDLSNTPQTHIFGATYDGPQNFQVSGDSPYIADEGAQTYDAPTGGILATVNIQVVGNEQGQQLFMNLDDNVPNPPGSRAIVFNGTGTTDINIAPANLGDGFHGEGVTCVAGNCTTQECPPGPGTPPPMSCPTFTATPPTPSTSHGFCNSNAFAVRGISVQYDRSVTASLLSNTPGCPSPTITGPDVRGYWHFDWGVTCIDPGEFAQIANTPAAMLRCWNWIDANGTPIGPFPVCDPTPTASPSPTPTCCTPTPTATPTATATATATPGTPPACPTPGPPPVHTSDETFTNNTGQAVNGLHARYTGPVGACVLSNAPGCASPLFSVGGSNEYFINWPTTCVDVGESVTVRVTSEPPASRVCAEWTHNDGVIGPAAPPQPICGTPTPRLTPGTITPTPSPTATATPTASPTRTPSAQPSTTLSFSNNTDQVATDFHLEFFPLAQISSVNVDQNPPGCPAPSVSFAGRQADLDWQTLCADPDESVGVTVSFTQADNFACAYWTQFGDQLRPLIGPSCGTPTGTATPGPVTPTPTPTPVSVAGHDAKLTKIGGVPKNVRLSPGEVINDSASVVVANDSNHAETIGVYVDVVAPSGCTPNGRVLQTTVTLGAGNKTTLSFPVSYSCSDVNAANGQSYSWTAVADHAADDLASCPPGSLQGLTCFNALADDDEDSADNRKARTGPKVIAQ